MSPLDAEHSRSRTVARLRRAASAATAAVVVVLAGCSASPVSEPGATSSGAGSSAGNSASANPASSLPAAPAAAERGAIVSRGPMPVAPDGPLAGTTVTRVVYRSSSGYVPGERDGTFGTQVSGVVAVPDGTPPAGGWPIIAFGHGTTGTAKNCGPSGYPDLLGQASRIATLVRDGYVVAASDYQGLGLGGVPHPYLDTETIAHNMIDMVRAARTVVPQAGTRWASLGLSQGGQAAWAAAEYATTEYGAGLQFVGAATLAPAADVSPIAAGYDAQPFVAPTFTQAQIALIPLIVNGLKVVNPDLQVSDYIRGGLAEGTQQLSSCGAGSGVAKFSALTRVRPGDATVSSRSALRELHSMLAADALPQRRAAAPLFVAYGDEDQIVTPAWTTAAVERACAQGDVVQQIIEPGRGHTNLTSTPRAISWIGDRFAGLPAPNTCP